MIISRTPFRISFFGGGTDFPTFFKRHGGAVLSSTINKYCYISIHRLTPLFKHRYRASYARTETVNEPEEFQHPLIRECLLVMNPKDGLEINHVADMPARTGLGTSSAFTVGLLNALHSYMGSSPAAGQLAREALSIERDKVADPGGCQDQYAAAHGGFNHIRFERDGTVSLEPVPAATATLEALEERLMLFQIGEERCSRNILHEQEARIDDNMELLQSMSRLTEQAVEALRSADLDGFGALLHESWQYKRCLSEGISSHEIDQAYGAAREAGAVGGKILGAGGGGFLLMYAAKDKHENIRRSLRRLAEASFRFSDRGSSIIFND